VIRVESVGVEALGCGTPIPTLAQPLVMVQGGRTTSGWRDVVAIPAHRPGVPMAVDLEAGP
jgi:hypothetical protein